jgi:16S rRNA (uracil1498-N3)-methyltransferase
MTRRRWIAEHWDEATATIDGAQAEHLARVLRAQPGMEPTWLPAAASFMPRWPRSPGRRKSEVRFNLTAELEADPALPVTLVLAIYKFDRMEWAIEKATELGVAAIAPVIARRTEKHLAQAAEKRAERWRRIAHEASQQARRSDVPLIHEPVDRSLSVCAPLLWPRASCLPSRSAPPRCVTRSEKRSRRPGREMPQLEIAIGPEGGWAPAEEALFDANGWRAASLGPRICAPRRPPSPRLAELSRHAWSDFGAHAEPKAVEMRQFTVEKQARILYAQE